jgi:hypothetical protein
MSLSPLTEADRQLRKRFFHEVEIAEEIRLYQIDNRAYKPCELKQAIVKHAETPVVVLGVDTVHEMKMGTSILSGAGLFTIHEGKICVRAIWKPCVLTLTGGVGSTHKTYTPDKWEKTISTGLHNRIQISILKQYHGPTRWLDDAKSLMQQHGKAVHVVAYKSKRLKGLYNMAYVRDTTWMCIVCNKSFKTEADWAHHTTPRVELPHGDHWRRVSFANDKICLSPNPFRCSLSRPQTYYHQNSLADPKRFGGIDKMWAMLMHGLVRNSLEPQDTKNWWARINQPTWKDVEDMVIDRVKRARDRWGGMVINHIRSHRDTEVKTGVFEDTNTLFRRIRLMGKPKHKRYIEESISRYIIPDIIGPDDTGLDIKTLFKKHRNRPVSRQRLYIKIKIVRNGETVIVDRLVRNEQIMRDFGINEPAGGLEFGLGEHNGRWVVK